MLLGIDLGGTKIEASVLIENDVIFKKRLSTEQNKGYASILEKINSLIISAENELGFTFSKFGLSHPGALESENFLIKNSNTQCLNKKPLKHDLEELTKKVVYCANDANCFALAEAVGGAGKGSSVVFGVIMGTGVGGGVIVKGEIIQGRQGIAGEWGHNIVDTDGDSCYCGKKGCVETFISGPALEKFHEKISGFHLPLSKIIADAKNSLHAKQTLERLIDYFGRSLSVVINILDPDVIVIGGGLSNIKELYTDGVSAVSRYVLNDRLKTKIVENILGDSAGGIGAAMLCR